MHAITKNMFKVGLIYSYSNESAKLSLLRLVNLNRFEELISILNLSK